MYEYARHLGGCGHGGGGHVFGGRECRWMRVCGSVDGSASVAVCVCLCLSVSVSVSVWVCVSVQVWYMQSMYFHVQCCTVEYLTMTSQFPLAGTTQSGTWDGDVIPFPLPSSPSLFPPPSPHLVVPCFSPSHPLTLSPSHPAHPAHSSHASKTGARTEPRPIRVESSLSFRSVRAFFSNQSSSSGLLLRPKSKSRTLDNSPAKNISSWAY